MKYDLAVSFAGEDRELARKLSERLDAAGYSIFFDEFHQAELWGRDLTIALSDVYAREARWCLVLVSEAYIRKPWTNLERQNALQRFMQEHSGYLLCLRLDGSRLPGFPDVVGYLDYPGRTDDEVYGLLLQRLGAPAHDDFIPSVSSADRDLASQIIKGCYRRALFTRMDSEIDMHAMYDSIGEAVGHVQARIPLISDPTLQFVASKIVRALDSIQRTQRQSNAQISNFVENWLAREIDDQKRQVIRLLLEIRRAAALPIQMPMALRTDHFFGPEAAREPPNDGA